MLPAYSATGTMHTSVHDEQTPYRQNTEVPVRTALNRAVTPVWCYTPGEGNHGNNASEKYCHQVRCIESRGHAYNGLISRIAHRSGGRKTRQLCGAVRLARRQPHNDGEACTASRSQGSTMINSKSGQLTATSHAEVGEVAVTTLQATA